MFDVGVAALAFGVVVLAELPDKTALAGLVLGTRYRASYVYAGMAAAFLLHVVLAIVAGSVLTLLPTRLLRALTGVLFLAGAAFLLLQRPPDEAAVARAREPGGQSFWPVAGAGFSFILAAEFGDLTQIVTANLAARYAGQPLSVGVGAVSALWAVGALVVLGGRGLIRKVPLGLVTKAAVLVMLVLGVLSLVEAVA
ncbi:integral membrane protein [Streptomyces sp. SPB78]|uniref:TMEM165/GDT1 family protein n=1 Tax=Streptomyces sp. (strain SPB78) TaxID=591157 RepID=UPI0001B548E3|nr:TMEM165/GDT1 family protein [Streptomyces sp. SPB78]EFK99460.1 integral membrane protein [Streptomyces sp. SPB78]